MTLNISVSAVVYHACTSTPLLGCHILILSMQDAGCLHSIPQY